MKKRLFSIITILGIGFSFCSASDSCSFNTDNFTPSAQGSVSSSVGVGLKVLNDGNYSISSLSLYCGYSRCPTINSINVCFGTGVQYASFRNWNSSRFSCIEGLSYTINDNIEYSPFSGYRTITFSTPIEFSSLDYQYVLFVFPGPQNYINSWKSDNNTLQEYVIGSNDFSFTNIIVYGDYYVPREICYSSSSGPKFKVNYGNTSYEYELDSDLSIYLKSPVIQNGNTFTYAGSTGLNLFYNGTSQRYNKSNLYLDSMFWFNNNIFTPICL